MDDNHKWYRSDNTILFKIRKSPEPGDHTRDRDEQSRPSATECDRGCISGLQAYMNFKKELYCCFCTACGYHPRDRNICGAEME